LQIYLSKTFTILDDETNIYEYENTIMVVDSNSSNDNDNSSTSRTPTQPPIQPTSSLECTPLLDYITNIMKFVEAILSNNSTDDRCKEFVKQKGLVLLLQILNLPIDFQSSTSCQHVAQVCKAFLLFGT